MRFVAALIVSLTVISTAHAEMRPVTNVLECNEVVKENVINYSKRTKLNSKAVEYLCSTSAASAETLTDAVYCAYNAFVFPYKFGRHKGTFSGEGTLRTCAFSDGNRNDCLISGHRYGYPPDEISRICNPQKNRVVNDEASLKE